MSKVLTPKSPKKEVKEANYYRLDSKNGGYVVLKLTVDINNNNLLKEETVHPEDVFLISSSILTKEIKKDLKI